MSLRYIDLSGKENMIASGGGSGEVISVTREQFAKLESENMLEADTYYAITNDVQTGEAGYGNIVVTKEEYDDLLANHREEMKGNTYEILEDTELYEMADEVTPGISTLTKSGGTPEDAKGVALHGSEKNPNVPGSLQSQIGDISKLNTTSRDNTVNAINELKNTLNNTFIIGTKTINISVEAGKDYSNTLDIDSYTGYTPVGIIGFAINNENLVWSRCIIRNNNQISLLIRNVATAGKSGIADIKILYIKNQLLTLN